MPALAVELTEAEGELFALINFYPAHTPHDYHAALASGEAARELTTSLLQRNAIPEVRILYFTHPELNIGRTKSSRKEIFEKNGCSGDEILRHPHFVKYLRYFIFGADLKEAIVEAFDRKVAACGPVTSGDYETLAVYAKHQVRLHHLVSRDAAEEFYKLALDCGLDDQVARYIRDAVKRMR